MAKIKYTEINLRKDRLDDIERANAVISEYAAQGFSLTVRQIYYQFVSRGWIENKITSYDYIQSLVGDARLAGLMDWDAIVDRTRGLKAIAHCLSARTMLQESADSFATWKWANQPNYVEVWVEKDALGEIVGQACSRWDVPFLSCRGYTSLSEMHEAALRLKYEADHGKACHILHLGDHDPSGMDMSRDIAQRLKVVFRTPVKIYRIALNRGQIDRYSPPPNPAKITDSRATGYIAEHGEFSWEVDALEPNVLTVLIQDNILKFLDQNLWSQAVMAEDRERSTLKAVAERWTEVEALMSRPPMEFDDNPYS